LFHFGSVLLAFLGEIVGAAPIAGLVGLVRAVEARTAFAGFLAREATEAVVFGFSVRGGVVEGCERVSAGCK
jgi:hypothetical protein